MFILQGRVMFILQGLVYENMSKVVIVCILFGTFLDGTTADYSLSFY